MTHLLCKCNRHFCALTLDIKVKLSLVSMTALSNLKSSSKVTKYLLYRQNKVGRYYCQLSWHFVYWATNKFNIQKYQSFYFTILMREKKSLHNLYDISLVLFFRLINYHLWLFFTGGATFTENGTVLKKCFQITSDPSKFEPYINCLCDFIMTFWQILISYCKFLMPRPLKWSILGVHIQ